MTRLQEPGIEITPVCTEDVDEILWVEESSFSSPWTRAMFEEEVKNQELCHYLIARQQNHVVGYMGFWLVQDEAHITNLAVHPAFRRRQIAERLLLATMKWAMRLGARRATLEVRASNQPAIRLYEKHGFKLIAIRRAYYNDNKEDALIMWADELDQFGPGMTP